MNGLSRNLGLAAVLLLLFLAAALVAEGWLEHLSDRLKTEAIATKRAQFLKAWTSVPPGRDPAAPDRLALIGALIDARVTVGRSAAVHANLARPRLEFSQAVPGGPAADVQFEIPATVRLSYAHAQIWTLLLVLALAIMFLFVSISYVWTRRTAVGRDSRQPWRLARAEMGSLERLARASVTQMNALAEERGIRERTEQDLLLNQRLLNDALEEKIRLGRDLHDDVIQSLYAVGLTLESAKPLTHSKPAEVDRRLDQCLAGINDAIRAMRTYVTGLAPEKLRRMSFAAAIELLVHELRAGREVGLDLTIDEDAACALAPNQATEALQIAREAISNSVRHGRAGHLTVRLHQGDREVGLLLQDDGCGFDPAAIGGAGHGLANMRARAEKLGATLRMESGQGKGTRVVATFPVRTEA